jgi:ferrous iron transport protein B
MTISQTRSPVIALVGNPNTGKSTLFSALVGVHQHVGNYPGVTVEKKIGQMELGGRPADIIDLPGLYSLAPRSRDEMVVVDLLLGRQREIAVDAVVCIVDGGNLERCLYLVSQVLELGLPVIVAVNMLDVAENRGVRVDVSRLERQLGLPVVAIQANRRLGLDRLKTTLTHVIAARGFSDLQSSIPNPKPPASNLQSPHTPLPEVFENEASILESEFGGRLPRCLVRRLLLDADGYLQRTLLDETDGGLIERIQAARARLAVVGCPTPDVETTARYDWARRVLGGVVTEPSHYPTTTTDRIDRVLTHRFWGLLIFAVIMLLVFQSVFIGAKPAMEWIEKLTSAVGVWLSARMAEGTLRSLLVDGVIGGVGSVVAFLPQILILFAFLAVLEDCGYMARTAFLMDRIMVRVGLSGKSFIPLLSSFACAVPGIMATRVIEDERDRLTTILVAPLLTCSARLPIYALMIAAFIPAQSYCFGLLGLQGLTLAALYLLGIAAAVAFAMLFKRTILRGQTPPFVMELPSYKWPSPNTVFFRVAERGGVFMRCAGTLILAVSILVWAALYYPHDTRLPHSEQQQNSYLGRAGRVIEPIVKPLGWDWRIGCAVIASFPAREVVVATLGVMYHIDDDYKAGSKTSQESWTQKLRAVTWDGTNRPVYTTATALSIMVFFALCAQCGATLAVIRRETNSWRWPAFTFAYMTVLAYVAAFVTYQLGTCLGG